MSCSTVATVAADVRAGRVLARDVVEEHLDLIDRMNPVLNAVVAVRADAARRDADDVDRLVRAGGDPGPLAGVPFTVKDTFATSDLPTTCGSRALAGHQSVVDAAAVRRLGAAGAVLLGKTNTPEFAFGVHTLNDLHGTTRHPDADTTVGGSSGGEAASVLAGFSMIGIGTDFGGSLRWPAQCTGTVGLRPEVGTVPTGGVLPPPLAGRPSFQDTVQVVGPIARTVGDARLVLETLNGTAAAGRSTRSADASPVTDDRLPRGVTLLWGAGPGGRDGTDQHRAVAELAEQMAVLGAHTVDRLPDILDTACDLYDELRAAEDHAALAALVGDRLDLVEQRNRPHLEPRAALPELSAGQLRRTHLEGALDDLLGDHTMLALPVATKLPDRPDPKTVEDFSLLQPCRAISLFGLAVIAVPWGRAADGAPVSVQLVAPRGGTSLILAAASQLVALHALDGAAS